MNHISEKDVQKAIRKNQLIVGCNNFKPETTTEISIAFSKSYEIHYVRLYQMGYHNLQEAIDENGGIAKVVLESLKTASSDFMRRFHEIVKPQTKEL